MQLYRLVASPKTHHATEDDSDRLSGSTVYASNREPSGKKRTDHAHALNPQVTRATVGFDDKMEKIQIM